MRHSILSPLNHINGQGAIRLYEPLRKSLLRPSLSQSRISSTSNLSFSVYRDCPASKLSKRMRSLSPYQAQIIKNNTFVPVNKKLMPTKNLYLVRDKKFEAIDVEQKVYEPISEQEFKAVSGETCEQIVYQPIDQAGTYSNRQFAPQKPFQFRNGNQFSKNTEIKHNQMPPAFTGNQETQNVFTQANDFTSFQQETFIPVKPVKIQTFFKNTTPNLQTYASVNSLNSNFSQGFGFSKSKPIQPIKNYDFNKLSVSSDSNYQQKKKEEWKYNLYSILDEPFNTKCSKTGCFQNQIIASKPNLYEWQQ